MADGQVSIGGVIAKANARKLRRMGHDNQVAVGFAGSAADALALCDLLEKKIEEHRGQVLKACVEMAKNWRTDKYLRPLNAVMIVASKDIVLEISGNGDVLEPTDGLIGIGSGGSYALAAARALIDVPNMEAIDIAKKAMTIAGEMCIYTNKNFTVEVIDATSSSSQQPVTGTSASTHSAQYTPSQKPEDKSTPTQEKK